MITYEPEPMYEKAVLTSVYPRSERTLKISRESQGLRVQVVRSDLPDAVYDCVVSVEDMQDVLANLHLLRVT